MCTLYERIQELCKQNGISPSRMCLDLGLSKSTMSDMKSGRKKGVSTDTANKIANYFGVTVGYLLGTEEKKAPTNRGECYESLKSNENVIRIAGRDGTFLERSLTDEQLSALVAMINQLPEAEDI